MNTLFPIMRLNKAKKEEVFNWFDDNGTTDIRKLKVAFPDLNANQCLKIATEYDLRENASEMRGRNPEPEKEAVEMPKLEEKEPELPTQKQLSEESGDEELNPVDLVKPNVQEQPDEEDAKYSCYNCGFLFNEEIAFCPSCGVALEWEL